MKKTMNMISIATLLLGTFAATASAQTPGVADNCSHDTSRGECSPGTDAPSRSSLMTAISTRSATALMATLEYGELVDCQECVLPLIDRVLSDDNAGVREFGAWWLRKRTFAANMAFDYFARTLRSDTDSVRRARAAEAVGEFLTPHAVPLLTDAIRNDADAAVRQAAVRGIGRTNHVDSQMVLALAMNDADASVRLAAVQQVNLVNAFSQMDALVGTLVDSDPLVRREAALQAGQRNVADAVPALVAMLRTDEDANARRSAAWALGSIGGAEARTALGDAATTESDDGVMQAIQIARQMR